MFKETYHAPEPTKYLVSDDDNFELQITHDVEANKTTFIITPNHIKIVPGIGVGRTLISALQKSRQELLEAVSVLKTRIQQLNKMIEEEKQKSVKSDPLATAELAGEAGSDPSDKSVSPENEKPADTPNAAGSSDNTSPSI